MPPELKFPRQFARTMRFALGTPRSFTIAPDGTRVAFLRSTSGVDRVKPPVGALLRCSVGPATRLVP